MSRECRLQLESTALPIFMLLWFHGFMVNWLRENHD